MGPNQSHTRKVEFVANIPLRKIFLVQKLRKSFKMVFVTLEKCLGQNRSSFLKKTFCMVYTLVVTPSSYLKWGPQPLNKIFENHQALWKWKSELDYHR